MNWLRWAAQQNDAIRSAGRWRAIRDLDASGPQARLPDGTKVVTFASNDYLGLAAHPDVAAAARAAIDRWGTGSGASRLVTGARPVHRELEHELADWKGTESALLFPTGYAANLGVLSVLGGGAGGERVTICSDELNHASIIDGCRLAGADVRVYRHADLDHLDAVLATAHRAIVVSDTVFSMDGDVAPVAELAARCARRGALLVLDEAHAVLGPATDELPGTVVHVGTLSKTLGSLGGFVAAPGPLVDLLINRARPFIFTTAPAPADTAAALAALRILRSASGAALVTRLRSHVDRVRRDHPSPIVAIILGDEQAALDASAALLSDGILVPAIRPPTVAPGTSRLRVTLSAAHTDDDLDRLTRALAQLRVAA